MTDQRERLVADMMGWAVPDLAVTLPPAGQGPLIGTEWEQLTDAAVSDRIAGLLWKAIENGMAVTPLQRIGAATMAHDSMRAVVELEATAQWVIGELESAGIDVRLIKGLATAHAVHEDVRMRDSGDIDLLVLPRDLERSAEVLRGLGLRPSTRWGDGANSFTKELVFVSETHIEIDLHQSLNFGARWRRLTPRLMADGMVVDSGDEPGPRFCTLNLEGLFVNAAISACRSDGRISGLLDVAAISHDPRLEPDRLLQLLDAEHLAPAVAPVLDKASRYFVIGQVAHDAVGAARHTRRGVACARLEASETGARYLYSCLSGSPRQWIPGLRALARPDDAHFAGVSADQRVRISRLATQSRSLLRSVPMRHGRSS
jgi:hypothetical protein